MVRRPARIEWREDVRASMWAGKAIAQALNRDPSEDRELIKGLLKTMFREGHIKTVPGHTSDHKPCLFIVPCDAEIKPMGTSKSKKKQRVD
jgi:hypothetical protein